MKRIFVFITSCLLIFISATNAQTTVEAFAMNPQTGAHNYFGVRATIAQTSTKAVTVTGYIYDDGGSPNVNHPFTIIIPVGDLSAETVSNFYETDPTASATAVIGTLVITYGGVPVTYERVGCILNFNSLTDAYAVLEQLEASYDESNDNYEGQYPNATDEDLDDLDEQNGFDEMQAYKDFEALFNGFCSKRAELEVVENTWLANDFGGTDPDDLDLTFEDAENTIFNNNYSFKVGNDTYQLTSTGMYKNNVLLDDGGNALLQNEKENLSYAGLQYEDPIKYSGPMHSMDFLYQPSNWIDCKSNKKSKLLQSFNNDSRRVKATVAITSIVIRNGVHGKLKNYKKKNNKWKKSRAEMSVYCAGTLYVNNCGDSQQFTDRNPTSGTKKRVKISTRRHSPAHIPVQGSVWKTKSGQVAMYGEVSGQIKGQLNLTF